MSDPAAWPLPTAAEVAEAAARIIREQGGSVAAEWVLRRTIAFSREAGMARPGSIIARRAGAINTAIESKLPAPPRKCTGCGEDRYVRWYLLRHLHPDTAMPAPDVEPLTVRWCMDCVESAQDGFGQHYGICIRAEARVDYLEPANQRRNLRLHSQNAIIPADWT